MYVIACAVWYLPVHDICIVDLGDDTLHENTTVLYISRAVLDAGRERERERTFYEVMKVKDR